MTQIPQRIKKGYKQTELGVIPEDWEVKYLGNIGSFSKGSGIKKDEVKKDGIPCIRYGELYTRYNNYIHKYYSYITPEVSSISRKLKKGDILFAGSGETKEEIGKCASLLSNDIVFAGGDIVILSPDKDNSKFLGYLLNSPYVVKQKSSKGQGDAVVHISSGSLSKIFICLPTVNEQSLIAQTLSDTDELITSLDALIEKKGQIKEGTMQELLTGKRRLPGFSGDWEVKKLGEIVIINKGDQLNGTELTTTGIYPAWNGGMEPSGYTDKTNTDKNTITISEGGNSCGFVNYCKTKFWLGGHCYALNFNKNMDLEKLFLYQTLKYNEKSIQRMRIGSGLPNIQKKSLHNFEVTLPKTSEEQLAISSILSDIDAEIASLKSKRDKYQRIKEGMMQELLTGNIRLIGA